MIALYKYIFVLFLTGFFTVASGQLPSEIMSDRYLVKDELLEANKDYAAAFNVM